MSANYTEANYENSVIELFAKWNSSKIFCRW